MTQYYNGKATLASADPVVVKLATTTSGINATMVKGGEVTGTVTDSATHAPIWGLCVDAFDSNGNDISTTNTDRTGAYTLHGAPPGSDRVEFHADASGAACGTITTTNYITQYYNGQSSLATANPVTVTPNATTSGINAAMVAG